MSKQFRLALSAQLVETLFAQARAELPNECCGLLAGHIGEDGLAEVVCRYRLTNVAASPVEYLSEGREMFAAERDMRQRGIQILAVYHSHPTSEPIPSRKDRERNYSPEVINLIISLQGTTPTMRGWWLTADTATEAVWEMIDENSCPRSHAPRGNEGQ